MFLEEEFFELTHALSRKFKKGDVIVEEESVLRDFYYLNKGEVGIYNCSDEGKMFLHHKVYEKNFFGEPLTLVDFRMNGFISVMSETAEVYQIKKEILLQYLKENPEWAIEFLISVAEKSIKKSELLRSIIYLNPEERILKHLTEYKNGAKEKMLISLTRKELSMMTGLRIETIIRTVKKMEKAKKLEIISGKIYY